MLETKRDSVTLLEIHALCTFSQVSQVAIELIASGWRYWVGIVTAISIWRRIVLLPKIYPDLSSKFLNLDS